MILLPWGWRGPREMPGQPWSMGRRLMNWLITVALLGVLIWTLLQAGDGGCEESNSPQDTEGRERLPPE